MMVIVLFHRPFSIDHSMFVCVCVRLIYIMPDTDHHFARCITALFENLYLLQTFTQRTIDLTQQSVEFSLSLNWGKILFSKKHEKLRYTLRL